jgi:hypothetical protein
MEPHERGGERPGESEQRADDDPEGSTRLAQDKCDRGDERRGEVERVSPGRTEAAGPVAERRLDQDRGPERRGEPQEGSAEPCQPEGEPGEDQQQCGSFVKRPRAASKDAAAIPRYQSDEDHRRSRTAGVRDADCRREQDCEADAVLGIPVRSVGCEDRRVDVRVDPVGWYRRKRPAR